MTTITARITWQRGGAPFLDKRYSRTHTWRFDGGSEIRASTSPHVVTPPLSDPAAVDPEEAFVASLSSCHMLWFLSIAVKRGFVVDSYDDCAEGELAAGEDGRLRMTRVVLRPATTWAGERRPSDAEVRGMHEAAHAECFIARSVNSTVTVEPASTGAAGTPA